jgi:hypothetical protein
MIDHLFLLIHLLTPTLCAKGYIQEFHIALQYCNLLALSLLPTAFVAACHA